MKRIYPNTFRKNNLSILYCDVALESYYDACQEFDKLPCDYHRVDEFNDMIYSIKKKLIIVTVFSAMCLEAFFNDYAATCLGDDEYYNNYDKLSDLSKFHIISNFILDKSVNKSEKYYFSIKRLFSRRDEYVHNKSQNYDWQYVRTERDNTISEDSEYEIILESTYHKEKDDIKNKMKEALDDLKAIKNVASYFDENDSGICAMNRLFNPYIHTDMPKDEIARKKYIFDALNIKVQKL